MRFLPANPPRHLRVRRFRGRLLSLTAAAAGLLVLAGCHLPGSSAAGAPAVSATLTVSALPGVADAPLYIGIKDGLFKAEGLTIRLRPYSSAKSTLDHLGNGSTDIAFADYADAFFANEQKPTPNLSLVADGYDCGQNVIEILTLPSSTITSPEGLEGKRIGTALPQEMQPSDAQPYSLETVAAWSALTDNNVTPGLNVNPATDKITWVPMQQQDLASALESHQVDAILATEPTIIGAETKDGVVPVLDVCSGATANMPLDGYFTSHNFAKQKPAVLAAFRSALAKAQSDAAISTPVQAALENYAAMDKQTASLVTIGSYPTTLAQGNVQRVANLMFFYGSLQTPLIVSGMVAH
jgi:NitT/TauT family transport system substrate-binding protein